MSLGRARRSSNDLVPAAARHASPRGSFYSRLAQALADERFDSFLEQLTRSCYAATRGRPSLPPGVYFRMLMIGNVEGIDSQRELAWRCADSLSLRAFLGFSPFEATPDHSTLTLARRRLPPEVQAEALRFGWNAARKHDVLRGRRLSFLAPFSASPPAPATS
jgi:hypothetical protein